MLLRGTVVFEEYSFSGCYFMYSLAEVHPHRLSFQGGRCAMHAERVA
jgi:hypothetical protein